MRRLQVYLPSTLSSAWERCPPWRCRTDPLWQQHKEHQSTPKSWPSLTQCTFMLPISYKTSTKTSWHNTWTEPVGKAVQQDSRSHFLLFFLLETNSFQSTITPYAGKKSKENSSAICSSTNHVLLNVYYLGQPKYPVQTNSAKVI